MDKDGKKELILCITTTSMAGMREVVYDYDEKADVLREEYNGNPYPEEIDREKSGIVYFVMEGDIVSGIDSRKYREDLTGG